MPLPIAASLDLRSATRLIATRTGKTAARARRTLVAAAIEDEIGATGCLHHSAIYPDAPYFAAALGDRQTVPAHAWAEAEAAEAIDWKRSRVGRYDVVRIARDEIEWWFRPPADARANNLAQVTAALPPPPTERGAAALAYKTGLAGRPTSWHLIETECRRRWKAGERHRKSGQESPSKWASELAQWLRTAHPEAAPTALKTLTNKLSPLLRLLTAASPKS
jgi:hypothetical protein